jgi:hypothetical protein
MNGQQVGALVAGGDAGGPPYQRVAFGTAREGDDHPLTPHPRVLLGAVATELVVDLAHAPKATRSALTPPIGNRYLLANR